MHCNQNKPNSTFTTLSAVASFGLIFAGVTIAGTTARAQGWWLEGGPVVRGGMKASVSGSSYAQQLGLHDPLAAGPLAPPGGIGTTGSYADRTYDNGYVKLDPGTGNTTPPNDPNTTWNWGFNDPGQYNAGAQTLSFQKQGAPGYTSSTDRSVAGSEGMLGAGLQLRGGVGFWQSGRWTLDLAMGFQGIWGANATMTATPYRETVRQVTVSDRYDTSGIGAANFPATGFRGTYLGPFDSPPVIPSPVLPNLPASRNSSTAVLSSSQDTVSLEAQQDLYEFSVGPQLGYSLGSRVKLSLRPTVSLDLLNVDVPRSEVFVQTPVGGPSVVVSRWSNQASQTTAVLGFGVTGGADLDLGKGFYAGLFGGYEWVAQQVNVSVGPNAVSFDGSGYVVGAVFGKRF
jgi:hypothetical protein